MPEGPAASHSHNAFRLHNALHISWQGSMSGASIPHHPQPASGWIICAEPLPDLSQPQIPVFFLSWRLRQVPKPKPGPVVRRPPQVQGFYLTIAFLIAALLATADYGSGCKNSRGRKCCCQKTPYGSFSRCLVPISPSIHCSFFKLPLSIVI